MLRMTYRIHKFKPVLRRSFSSVYQNSKLPFLQLNFTSNLKCLANIHLKQPKQFDWDQYSDLNQRLESVPYQDLLNKGVERFHGCFTDEDNKSLADVVNWCSKVFDYNLRDGKKIRAVALLKAFCAYAFPMEDESWKAWKSEGWQSAVTLAWCVEMLQAYFLMCDDIMDQSSMRRGKPCWYKKSDVGLCAINDAIMLQCGIYKVLQKELGHLKSYSNLLHEFLQVTHKTVYGQCLDMLSNPLNERPQFSKFTFERYQTLVEYKTSNYTFCLPVHLAMHLAGRSSPKEFSLTRDLCLKLGLYFQSQDDYLDCFGNPEVTGKLGNDIREGKLTWLAVKFLEEASPEKAKEFMDNYGTGGDDSTSKVMDLYKDSSLLTEFENFKEGLCSEIRLSIESMNDTKGGLFYNLFSQIKKREK